MNKRVVLVHFQPLELFPPIMNALNYFSENSKDIDFTVITTQFNGNLNAFENPNINIIRLKGIQPELSKLRKLFRYFSIYTKSFFVLWRKKPNSILYYETLSALSCLIYKIIFRKTHLLAHYHEFVSLKELKTGRSLNKMINDFERKLYNKYKWISQTNQHRIDHFIKENNLEKQRAIIHSLPNYPSENWIPEENKMNVLESSKIRIVHIGALSFDGMYLKKSLEYFEGLENVKVDFYSHTKNETIISEISKYSNCNFCGAINYKDIPSLYGKYDVGLVLYNGSSLNVSYCAPNKIFEYLALDLDVWCSNDLITSRELERTDVYPKVIMVNYEKLIKFDISEAIDREHLHYSPSPYTCENVYDKLLKQLNEDPNTES